MTDLLFAPLTDNQPMDLVYPYSPSELFMVSATRTRSQQAFLQDVIELAKRLPSKTYGINLCEDRYGFLVGFCALLLNQSINLLPPNRQAVTLNDLLADYPDSFILVDKSSDSLAQLSSNSVAVLSELDTIPTATTAPTVPKIPAAQIAALAFTSGSTGKPKPNEKPFGTLAGLARILGRDLLQGTAPVMIATVPSQHMYGLETTIFMALQTPAILHNQKPFFPADVKAVLDSLDRPALLISTPTHLRALTQAELKMPMLQGIVSATAPLDTALAAAAEATFSGPLHEIYGCTEAGSMALRRSTQGATWTLLQGFYFTQDEVDTTAHAPHLPISAPLQDQISCLNEREFLLQGRNADMINVAGKRASLNHLNIQLQSIRGVIDAVVFMPDGQQREPRPAAFVVSDRSEREILADLSHAVDAAFLPRPLKKVSHLPRNETGKLTHSTLMTLWESLDAERL